MPSKRVVLEELKRDELLAALDLFELEVADRRVRAQLIDALAGSRRARLAEALGQLPRTRLKEICRALDMDDSGREKALLVARLTGIPISSPASAPNRAEPKNLTPVATTQTRNRDTEARIPPPRAAQGSAGEPRKMSMMKDLKSHLWNCAQILRGSAVDRTDWKAYILPLLFFKRILRRLGRGDGRSYSSVWRCRSRRLPGGPPLPCSRGCHWGDVRAAKERWRRPFPRYARDRAREPRYSLPGLRSRRLGQQGNSH